MERLFNVRVRRFADEQQLLYSLRLHFPSDKQKSAYWFLSKDKTCLIEKNSTSSAEKGGIYHPIYALNRFKQRILTIQKHRANYSKTTVALQYTFTFNPAWFAEYQSRFGNSEFVKQVANRILKFLSATYNPRNLFAFNVVLSGDSSPLQAPYITVFVVPEIKFELNVNHFLKKMDLKNLEQYWSEKLKDVVVPFQKKANTELFGIENQFEEDDCLVNQAATKDLYNPRSNYVKDTEFSGFYGFVWLLFMACALFIVVGTILQYWEAVLNVLNMEELVTLLVGVVVFGLSTTLLAVFFVLGKRKG